MGPPWGSQRGRDGQSGYAWVEKTWYSSLVREQEDVMPDGWEGMHDTSGRFCSVLWALAPLCMVLAGLSLHTAADGVWMSSLVSIRQPVPGLRSKAGRSSRSSRSSKASKASRSSKETEPT